MSEDEPPIAVYIHISSDWLIRKIYYIQLLQLALFFWLILYFCHCYVLLLLKVVVGFFFHNRTSMISNVIHLSPPRTAQSIQRPLCPYRCPDILFLVLMAGSLKTKNAIAKLTIRLLSPNHAALQLCAV